MADKIGDVYYEAHIRGDDLNKEARKLGDSAGTEMGKSAKKTFQTQFSKLSQELIPELKRQGKLNGNVYTNAFENAVEGRIKGLADKIAHIFSRNGGLDEFASGFGRVDDAANELRRDLEELNGVGALNEQMWARHGGTLNRWLGIARKAEVQQAESAAHDEDRVRSLSKLDDAFEKNSQNVDKNGLTIERGRRRMRRWVAITLLVAAALPEIGTLGSAVGGALAVIGGAAASGALGLGVAVAAFKDINKELSELPANVRPAAAAFQGFSGSLSGLQDAIQGAAVPGLKAGFDSLKATVEALTPAFAAFGKVVGDVFAAFAASLAPGTAGFEKLQFFIEKSAPIFEALVQAVMSLGGALGGLFIAAQPFILAFAQRLAEVLEIFNQWTTSFQGKNQLADWFSNAEAIFGGLIDVAVSLGQTLGDIVTPETVASFVKFLGQLAGFLPAVTALVKVIEDLGIFSILGALFEALGPVIQTLAPSLSRLAETFSGVLIEAIESITPLLLEMAKAFIPLLEALSPIIEVVVQLAAILIQALLPAIKPLIPLLVAGFTAIGEGLIALMPLIEPVLLILGKLIEIIVAVVATFIALFTGDFQTIGTIWTDLWDSLPEPLQDFITNTIGMFGDFFSNTIGMFADFFSNTFGMFKDFGANLAKGWQAVWNNVGNIVKASWNNILGFIEGGINGAIDLINGLIKGINDIGGSIGIHLGTIPKLHIPRLAAGAVAWGPMLAQIGERGPEAVVPLRRPLGQVDPSVRPLSAMAQGLSSPSKTVNIEAGAFQVITPARDPAIVTSMVMDATILRALN